MRTHFPGALHEVRSAARFPLSVEGVAQSPSVATGDCANGKANKSFVVRHRFLTNSKEDEHMDKELNTAAGAPTESKCPFAGGASAHDEPRAGGRTS